MTLENAIGQDDIIPNWQAEAELRVNLIRMLAIAGFYFVHFLHVYSPGWGSDFAGIIGFATNQPVDPNVHIAVSIIAFGWLMLAFAVQFIAQQQRSTYWLALFSTLGDLVFLTSILALSTGPKGPMVAGYFLIVMLAGLRFDLRLIRVTTLVTIVAYIALLGVAKWPSQMSMQMGIETVPRYHQIMTVVALAFAGGIMGQVVRLAYSALQVGRPVKGVQDK
jgi:hypothetical protein